MNGGACDCRARATADMAGGPATGEDATEIGNSNHPSGPSLPTTPVRLTGLMLSPSLGAAWFAWAIRTASRFLRRAPAVARPPDQRAAPPTNRPRCRALDPGQADPYRLPHPATESRLIVLFTAAWIVPAAPAPRAAARNALVN